ncbi:metallophosphoesterase [Pseudonocardia xishanensis]|uniref:Metallophosphoesterase n=1 Tax=Pseudonocardia xishanensis TaxID=630995 RepID=A0ABP8RTT0_9PSEU
MRYPENREVAAGLAGDPGDWLIVAGDVAERVEDVVAVLADLAARFARVIWVPGNHELWTRTKDPVDLRGAHRYAHLVQRCRELGVVTPEDEFPVFEGRTIVPLFLLYDYSFLPAGTSTSAEGLAAAYKAGVVCTDEHLLYPDPYASREEWSAARIAYSRARLDAVEGPTVLVNHWPLTRLPTDVLRHPEFVLWCGTTASADWHVTYRAEAVVYGHLHIPRVTYEDGVRFVEASLGYPREWKPRQDRFGVPAEVLPRVVLPVPADDFGIRP